ncbi:MAG: VWA domain-containing protein [Acidobacteria bacterium]|nr:VWA domain-containing protein [Acidobacteriota bacterium]
MTVSFLYPWFLLLAPAIALLWFLPRRSRGRDRTQRILRTGVFLLVVLALARPVLLTSDSETYQVFVVDESGSVSPARRVRQREAVAQLRGEFPASTSSLVVVGAGFEDRTGFGAVTEIRDSHSGSPLGAAIGAAARQVPEGARGVIHLFTDGLATDRRWAPEVQQVIDRGITLHTYDLGYDPADVYPAGLTARGLLRVGQTAHVEVSVAGTGTGLRVRLVGAGGEEIAVSAPFDSDEHATVPLTFEPKSAGFLSVAAQVVDAEKDSNSSNNEFRGTLAVQDPLRVFYLGDRVRGAASRMGGLLGRGFDVADGSTQALSPNINLSSYDMVLLDDRPASLVPESFQQHLADAVAHQGLGLVFSGGKSAFGTGGYDGTPVATISPVEFVQRTEKRDPSTALAIIIDTSGSMTGTRLELAKQVARLAVRRLKAHDRIGIVEFYGNKHWAVPLQSAANKITIDRAIGRMQAIGGTVLRPGLEEAYYGLKNVDTRYKHILVITDAGVETSDYETIIRQLTKDGINLSTVLVGAQAHNQLLIDLASWGKGRFYSAIDRYSLPEVILKQPSTMKLPAYKTGAFGVQSRGGEGWWSDIDRRAMPALNGYVETTMRDGADALMEVAGSGDPLLATWRYGLGRVTAMMTEPVGEGTTGWARWRDYGRMMARIVSRTADDSRLFDYQVQRIDHEVEVTARRTSRDSTLYPEAAVLDTEGRQTGVVTLRELAPGHFSGRVAVDPAEAVRVLASAHHVSGAQAGQQPTHLISPALDDVAGEQQVDPVKGLDLEALAAATGGAYTDPELLTAGTFTSTTALGPTQDAGASLSAVRLWPVLLLLGLLLYLAEITYRRWPSASTEGN